MPVTFRHKLLRPRLLSYLDRADQVPRKTNPGHIVVPRRVYAIAIPRRITIRKLRCIIIVETRATGLVHAKERNARHNTAARHAGGLVSLLDPRLIKFY